MANLIQLNLVIKIIDDKIKEIEDKIKINKNSYDVKKRSKSKKLLKELNFFLEEFEQNKIILKEFKKLKYSIIFQLGEK